MLGILGIKGKTKVKIFAVFVIAFFVIASIFSSYYFFSQKQKAEKYQTLVDEGVISQGEDVNLANYDNEGNLLSDTIGVTSSGGGGGGSSLSSSSGTTIDYSEEPVVENMGAVITFYGVWTTEDDSGDVGGQDEAS